MTLRCNLAHLAARYSLPSGSTFIGSAMPFHPADGKIDGQSYPTLSGQIAFIFQIFKLDTAVVPLRENRLTPWLSSSVG
jgi:hypothetical protein